jgi:hypothetical protein
MTTTQSINRKFEAIGWGALFIWWGISLMVPSLPNGTTALGTGLILIGVNIARKLSGIPTIWFSTTIGILALVWGGLELVGVLVGLPYELPIFAILLIVLGLIVLAPELKAKQNQ